MSLVPLVLVLWAPLSAALHTSVAGLPSESFQLRSAPWLNGSRGFVTESGAVYRRLTADSLCDCMTQCLVDVGCVSLSFATNSTGLCLLNSVRGGPHNTRFDEGMAHRIRPRLGGFDLELAYKLLHKAPGRASSRDR
ncbi:uncharacterized protein LOC122376837 [Amphibalanus amphitrite]|uniref:uncharacterized protein LOC122376837 n=1 Tax=Amphibalanus amphitrite TaxID=1232801 RepID=UPI001C923B68|nr:uncharacterized protein LOC122376837 [Amphibalanus amphitrite]